MIDFKEIKNGQDFEDLVSDLFREKSKPTKGLGYGVSNVLVQPSGVGVDGGRDILIEIVLSDGVRLFQRKWVVQCKFYNSQALSNAHLNDVNIPTLIHEYGADGYLLVCSGNISSKLSNTFENLNKNCKLGYSYEWWDKSHLTRNLFDYRNVIARHLPLFFEANRSFFQNNNSSQQ